MQFTDTWILDDTEALNLLCEVILPTTGQKASDKYGIGGSETSPLPETRISIHCMEVPEGLAVDYDQGVHVKISRSLVVDDPCGYVQPQRVIWFQGESFRVKDIIAPQQHSLKRVTLEKVR